ncbi:MAG: rane protein [Marmoricola sp.]|nr:rane protein [Marmoricola sp.]
MGFINPSEQPVEPATFLQLPLRERIRILAVHWVDDGFGTPRVLHVVYVLKMLGLYFGVGLAITSWTTAGVHFGDPGTWFDNIVVYQKLAIWLMLLEVLGLAGAFGPLCGHFTPMLGNVRYWIRPGTLRMAPWGRHVPGTGGDERTLLDVGLYLAVLASLVYPLAVHAVRVSHVPLGTGPQELVPVHAFIPILVTMPLMGLRDKVVFLAARSEQYLPIMLFSATLGALVTRHGATSADFVDLVVAFKIIICIVWIGAGTSKLGLHFVNVVPAMVSNQPGQPGFVKRAHYRSFPDDLRPSSLAWFMAHVGGTTVEIIIPVTLLLTTNNTVARIGAIAMLVFHIFITSTFPLAVPLEWNVYFGYIAIVLWGGFGHGFGASVYNIWSFDKPLLLIPVFALLTFWPILGNLRPELVSFLPSMRQYAGNWASAIWLMKPGIEERLNELPMVENQVDQLQRMKPTPYEKDDAEMTLQKVTSWRALHSQGRGLFSAAQVHLDDIETRTIRDGEFVCNAILGWNFGDGHLHDDRLIAAVQKRLNLAPGDLVVAYCESQRTPWLNPPQEYRVIDAALGVVERGTWDVADCVAEQPWLPNGPIPLNVTWTRPGYTRTPVA